MPHRWESLPPGTPLTSSKSARTAHNGGSTGYRLGGSADCARFALARTLVARQHRLIPPQTQGRGAPKRGRVLQHPGLADFEAIRGSSDQIARVRESAARQRQHIGNPRSEALYSWQEDGGTPGMFEDDDGGLAKIVRSVRFPGWQRTSIGEGEVNRAVRKPLFMHQLHSDADVFEAAYGNIVQNCL